METYGFFAMLFMAGQTITTTTDGRPAETSVRLSVNVVPAEFLTVNETDLGEGLVRVEVLRNSVPEQIFITTRESMSGIKIALVDGEVTWSITDTAIVFMTHGTQAYAKAETKRKAKK